MAKRFLICYLREFIAMEIRHLRYFVAVAEALSFTKAAIMLHLAQPSLTRQIRALEEEFGVVLLNRTKHQVSLTTEGRSFLIDAKRLLKCRLRIQSFLRFAAADACFVSKIAPYRSDQSF
jgi:LysR family hca operon transcriptional activator